MSLKYLFLLTAVIALIFGLGFLLVPAQALALYGVEDLAEAGLNMTRYFGTALLGFAVLAWLVQGYDRSEALNAVVLAFLVCNVLGLVVAVWQQLGGSLNQLGWLNVVVYLVLALGYAYFQFMAPKEQPAT